MIQFSKNGADLHMSSMRSTMKNARDIKLCAPYNSRLKSRLRDSSYIWEIASSECCISVKKRPSFSASATLKITAKVQF